MFTIYIRRFQKDTSKTKEPLNFKKMRPQDMLYTAKDGNSTLSYTKDDIVSAIEDNNVDSMREISSYFFGLSGIYSRLLYHMSTLYTFDNVTTPVVLDDGMNVDKIKKSYNVALAYKRKFNVEKTFSRIALKVLLDGVYYGYLREGDKAHVIQVLPIKYCRSLYEYNGQAVVEFNVKYFDEAFRIDAELKERVLKTYPKEVRNAYVKYKNGTLETADRTGAWAQLDTDFSIMFRMNEKERPAFISVIPDIVDLSNRKDSEDRKDLQDLYKMMIQKMPIDKNGELIFDLDEAKEMHENAVAMLSGAPGMDVLTTFADTDVLNLQDKNSRGATADSLKRAYETVYAESGTSKMVFSTEGNLSLKESIINDEALMWELVKSFKSWFEHRINLNFAKNQKKMFFTFDILPITRHNRSEKIKEYKEMATYGYPKTLAAVAQGMSQETFVGMLNFENNVMELGEKMIPLSSAHTKGDNIIDEGGREPLDDNEKSDKTLENEVDAEGAE